MRRDGSRTQASGARGRGSGSPESAAGHDIHRLDRAVSRDVGEKAVAVRTPSGCHGGGVASQHPVGGRVPVSAHDLQRAALEVGHREAVRGAPGRVVQRPCGRSASTSPCRRRPRQRAGGPRPRPRECRAATSPPPRTRRAAASCRPAHRIAPAPRDREHRAAARQRGEARACARRVERRRSSRRTTRPPGDSAVREARGRAARTRAPPARRRDGARRAAGARSASAASHHRPAAGGRLGLARQRHVAQAVADGVRRAHRSITSPSRSSARRSREFTVPRGMSRAWAISPGV